MQTYTYLMFNIRPQLGQSTIVNCKKNCCDKTIYRQDRCPLREPKTGTKALQKVEQ